MSVNTTLTAGLNIANSSVGGEGGGSAIGSAEKGMKPSTQEVKNGEDRTPMVKDKPSEFKKLEKPDMVVESNSCFQ